MKTCKDCGTPKNLSEFHPKTSNKDGYDVRCKVCRNLKYNKQDPDRVARKILERQISHSIDRGHPQPAYTLQQLVLWMDAQPSMVHIWDQYVSSGYHTSLRPSVDRKDDNLPYTLNNIQLITWGENRKKGAQSKMQGTVNANQRAVAAYNLDSTHHKDFISIMEAARYVGGRMWGVASVANNKPVIAKGRTYLPKTYKGYKWQWI